MKKRKKNKRVNNVDEHSEMSKYAGKACLITRLKNLFSVLFTSTNQSIERSLLSACLKVTVFINPFGSKQLPHHGPISHRASVSFSIIADNNEATVFRSIRPDTIAIAPHRYNPIIKQDHYLLFLSQPQ